MAMRWPETAVLLAGAVACRQAITPVPTASVSAPTPEERKVITAAEAFVRTNCYTTLPCDPATAQLEFPESRGTPEQLLSMRRAMLNPRAFGISPGIDGGRQRGWTVYFEYSDYFLTLVATRVAALQPPHKASESGLRGLEMNTPLTQMRFVHLDLRRDVPAKHAYPPSAAH